MVDRLRRRREVRLRLDGCGAAERYRPSYREADAHDGWKRLLDWFAKHGVA